MRYIRTSQEMFRAVIQAFIQGSYQFSDNVVVLSISQYDTNPMPNQSWANVADDGPTPNQHRATTVPVHCTDWVVH